jgi:hypothetical protein
VIGGLLEWEANDNSGSVHVTYSLLCPPDVRSRLREFVWERVGAACPGFTLLLTGLEFSEAAAIIDQLAFRACACARRARARLSSAEAC